jgi:antitoxin YefM
LYKFCIPAFPAKNSFHLPVGERKTTNFVPHWYIKKQRFMVIVSSREFRDNQKKYFDLVDHDEQVIIQRGKDKSYILSPLTEIDRMSTNPELIAKVLKAEKEIAKGNVINLSSKEDIKEFLGL